jgi:hypothetical protein
VRWLIAAGIHDFQAMLDELGKLQTDLPRHTPAPNEPIHDHEGWVSDRPPSRWVFLPRPTRAPAVRFVAGTSRQGQGLGVLSICPMMR